MFQRAIDIQVKGKHLTLIERIMNRKQRRYMRTYVCRSTQNLEINWDLFKDLPTTMITDNSSIIPKVIAGPDLLIGMTMDGIEKSFLFETQLIHSGMSKLEKDKWAIHFDPSNVRIKAHAKGIPMVFLFEYNNNTLKLMNIKFKW